MKKETAILWFTEDSTPLFHEKEGDFFGVYANGVPVRGEWYSNTPGNVTIFCGVEEYDYDKKWVPVPNGPSSWDSFNVPNKVQRDQMVLEEIKENISSRGYSFISMRIADEEDEELGQQYCHHVSCSAGDRLVTMIGKDRGSIEWTENYGPSNTMKIDLKEFWVKRKDITS